MNEKRLEEVTRLEVIDEAGRLLVLWNVKIELASFQDQGRTLKIFVERKKND